MSVEKLKRQIQELKEELQVKEDVKNLIIHQVEKRAEQAEGRLKASRKLCQQRKQKQKPHLDKYGGEATIPIDEILAVLLKPEEGDPKK